jgi:ligand-binding sensor domain-containing protein
MARRSRETFKLQVLFYVVFYLCLCAILSIHVSAEARRPPAKSLAALADARRLIFHQGCLWAAGGGVTRYNIASGRAKQYVVEEGLTANAVFDATVDGKNNVLWAATSCGPARLDLETNQWKSLGTAGGLFDPFVLSLGIYEWQGKTWLFIGTRSDGLYFLTAGSDKITRAVDKKILPDLWVSSIAADPGRNYLWLGTAAGVVRCQLKKGKQPLKKDPLLAHNRIAAKRLVLDVPTGDIFCLNYYNEIFLYRLSAKKWEKIPSPSGKDIKITDLVLDRAASILWTASDRGIYGCNLKQKQWIRLPGYSDYVSCLTLDAKNSLLYYTSMEGLRALSLNKSFCGGGPDASWGQFFQKAPPLAAGGKKESSLLLANSPPFNNTVNAIFIDEKSDTTWIGTDWGIAKFEEKTRRWKFFDLPIFPGERVTALSVVGNTVWFGTMYHGAARMDWETGMIEEIKGTPDHSTVTCIIADTNVKKVWFGLLGTRGGVYEYNIEKKKLNVLPFLEGLSVTSMLEEGDWIWVGTARGVAKFHKLEGPGPDLFDRRLAFRDVLTLALDSKRNHLWITTEYEVIVYDGAKKQHKIFKSSDGFPWSPITSILFAGDRIWLGSEGYGLYMYNPREKVKKPLTRLAGIADRYIISLAYEKSQGTIWAGTVSGGISVVKINKSDI